MDEVDIGVYTTHERLVHKIGLVVLESLAYWKIVNLPKDKSIRRIYFACEGFWKGYFDVSMVENEYEIPLLEWHCIDPDEFPRTSFQGFTYDVPEED